MLEKACLAATAVVMCAYAEPKEPKTTLPGDLGIILESLILHCMGMMPRLLYVYVGAFTPPKRCVKRCVKRSIMHCSIESQ